MLSQPLLVVRLIGLLINVVEDKVFNQLVEAGVLLLETFRVTLRRGRLNRVLLCD